MSLQTLEPSSLIVSINETGIAILELNRPRKRNALSQGMIDELTGALSQLDRSPTVFAVVLTSSGPFSGI
jgi:enoyl-CoA hydratase